MVNKTVDIFYRIIHLQNNGSVLNFGLPSIIRLTLSYGIRSVVNKTVDIFYRIIHLQNNGSVLNLDHHQLSD